MRSHGQIFKVSILSSKDDMQNSSFLLFPHITDSLLGSLCGSKFNFTDHLYILFSSSPSCLSPSYPSLLSPSLLSPFPPLTLLSPLTLSLLRYGCDLAYTPMIVSDSFVQSSKARDVEFTTNEGLRSSHCRASRVEF